MRFIWFHNHLPAETGSAPRCRMSVRAIPMLAVICLLLAGTVLGIGQFRALQLNQPEQVRVHSTDSGRDYTIHANSTITVSEEAELPPTATIISVRPGWLPDTIAEAESCTLQAYLHGTSHPTDHLTTETRTQTYTRCITCDPGDSGDPSVNIEVFSGTTIANGSLIPHGTTTLEQEGTLCGMEALWLKQEEVDKDGNYAFTIRSLVLYDPDLACVIYIAAGSTAEDIGYDIPEQVAAELELIDSGIPCEAVAPLDWALLSLARG